MTPHQKAELERLLKYGPQARWSGRTKEGRAQKRLVALGYAEYVGNRVSITGAGRMAVREAEKA